MSYFDDDGVLGFWGVRDSWQELGAVREGVCGCRQVLVLRICHSRAVVLSYTSPATVPGPGYANWAKPAVQYGVKPSKIMQFFTFYNNLFIILPILMQILTKLSRSRLALKSVKL